MAKKLKQGQKYQEGFTQKQILLKLCEKDKTPTTEIFDYLKDCFGIREHKNIRIHLEKLEKEKLIKRESAGIGHVNYWSLITTLSVLKKIVIRLNHDFDSQRKFMESAYFHNWIPKLSHQFNQVISTYGTLTDVGLDAFNRIHKQRLRDYGVESAPELITKLFTDEDLRNGFDLKRYTIDVMNIYNNPDFNETGRLALNNDELNILESSLKHNWLALKYVVSFLLADPQMQRQMYVNMIEDSKNVLTLTDGDLIRFFNQLDQLNFNYGFLFD